MRLVFFKRAQHRRFDFFPRFYDPVKDDLQRRIDLAESDAKRELRKAQMREKLESYRQHDASSEDRTAILIRLLLVVLLSGLFWLFFQYGHIFEVLIQEQPKIKP